MSPTLFIPMKTPLSRVSTACVSGVNPFVHKVHADMPGCWDAQVCADPLDIGSTVKESMEPGAQQALVAGWKHNQPPAHPWTIDHLLDTQAAAGRRIGLIMDLSNHDTLYAEDLPASLEYRHIQLVAKVSINLDAQHKANVSPNSGLYMQQASSTHNEYVMTLVCVKLIVAFDAIFCRCVSVQMLPSQETVDEVIQEAQAFWQAHPDLYIAIHCAYGAQITMDQ